MRLEGRGLSATGTNWTKYPGSINYPEFGNPSGIFSAACFEMAMTLAVELEVVFRVHHSRQQASVVLLRLVAGHFPRQRAELI